MSTDHRNRKSAGHVCFAGDYEFYKQADEHGDLQIIRAKRGNAFDLEGHRHGRWECSAAFLAARDFETVTGLQPEPAVLTGRAAHDADPDEWYCEDCGEQIDSASKGCQNPECSAACDNAQAELDKIAGEYNAGWSPANTTQLELHDHGNELPTERFAVYTEGGYSAGCVASAATPSEAVTRARCELLYSYPKTGV